MDSKIFNEIKGFFTKTMGIDDNLITPETSIFQMGIDSVMMITVVAGINDLFHINLSLSDFTFKHNTISKICTYVEENVDKHVNNQIEVNSEINDDNFDEPINEKVVETVRKPEQREGAWSSDFNGICDIIINQKDTMELIFSKQLDLLKSISTGDYTQAKSKEFINTKETLKKKSLKLNSDYEVNSVKFDEAKSLTAKQQKMLNELIESLAAKTNKSKELASKFRPYLADLDEVAGFSPLLKEIHYQITVESSNGSKMTDVDGNQYVDIAMGFGTLLMGHSPDIVMDAIRDEVDRGLQLAPRHRLVGEVAQMVCELTSFERACFTVTGTEAVMTAMKFARASTGKSKIGIFTGCYHGHNDATLVTKMPNDEVERPIYPGISKAAIGDTVLLDYNDMNTLEKVVKLKDELAAVLVEPVQSRRPGIHPVEFLRALRKVTEENGILLIFDEVITGFRCNAGGAKRLFGIEPDMATYGKAACNGIPIGIIAGRKEVMDTADGGQWKYGDNSYPSGQLTFYAGTFFKHPFTMAVAYRIMKFFKEDGNKLQEELAKRTDYLVNEINTIFKEYHVPIEVNNFTSLYKFRALDENTFIDIFFYKLLDYGIFTWEGRTCFMSSAHTENDIQMIIEAVRKTVVDMSEAGFYKCKQNEILEGFIDGIPDKIFYD